MAQRVLVTAGANGVGLTIARAFAADGARVHIADIDAVAVAAATRRGQLSGTVADLSDPTEAVRLIDDAHGRLGGLDVLVNNAGVTGPKAPVDALSAAAWSAVLDLNLTGTFLVTQAAVPLLRQSGRGAIIVMSSLSGRFGHPGRIAYATTKWGLVGFTRTLAVELGQHGITANTINPGPLADPRRAGDESPASVEHQSIRRLVDPADVAALAVFLAGPHARTISGQTFPIDGDAHRAGASPRPR
ncbi:3-oxoacyl-ACP reductase FabG [Pilimelia columellifera]|uniref:SDR family oxidoreductase n=1 Tax=Pilimelia columellifera subsp. columellifera TaxID=706583 RepID=A0ABN3NFH6_9ACTN